MTKPKKIQKKVSRLSGRILTPTDDFKTATLLVSVTINLAIFVGWLVIKLSTEYDNQVASFLFDR